jgi:hypothetical protein
MLNFSNHEQYASIVEEFVYKKASKDAGENK